MSTPLDAGAAEAGSVSPSISAFTSIDRPTEMFPLLADPDRYQACQWELSQDTARRAYWLPLFRRHFPTMLQEAVREALDRGVPEADIQRRIEVGRQQMNAMLDDYEARPGAHGPWHIMTLCQIRERVLRRQGIDDPYRLIKTRENAAALQRLPALLAELDALPDDERPLMLAMGLFAGNIFDLGATTTQVLFENGRTIDFGQVRARLKPRPWLVDGLDDWLDRLRNGTPHRAAVIFVDNAGCDIALGVLPFARDLLARGTQVILTANATPSLNDITIDELTRMIHDVAHQDATIGGALREGRLELVSSGNDAPLIDLGVISPELAEAVVRRGVDLVMLQGMGRGIESNFDALFTCESLKVAMVKDKGVAQGMGGELYDLVFRYDTLG